MRAPGLVAALLVVAATLAGCSDAGRAATSSTESSESSEPSASTSSAPATPAEPVENLSVTEVCTRAAEIWPRTASLDLEDLRAVESQLFEISTEPTNAEEAFALIHLQLGLEDAIASSVSDSFGAMRRELARGYDDFEKACREDGARF